MPALETKAKTFMNGPSLLGLDGKSCAGRQTGHRLSRRGNHHAYVIEKPNKAQNGAGNDRSISAVAISGVIAYAIKRQYHIRRYEYSNMEIKIPLHYGVPTIKIHLSYTALIQRDSSRSNKEMPLISAP